MAKLKEILAPKLKKIAKTQVFGKSACVHGPPDCERKGLDYLLLDDITNYFLLKFSY